MKHFFSLKLKLFILLITLPLLVIGTFIYFTIDEFEKDKAVYIYDSNLLLTRSSSAQISSELANLWNITESSTHYDKVSIVRISSNGIIKFKKTSSLIDSFEKKKKYLSFLKKEMGKFEAGELGYGRDESGILWIWKKFSRNHNYKIQPLDSELINSIFKSKKSINYLLGKKNEVLIRNTHGTRVLRFQELKNKF